MARLHDGEKYSLSHVEKCDLLDLGKLLPEK